jgi:hypothetical protein
MMARETKISKALLLSVTNFNSDAFDIVLHDGRKMSGFIRMRRVHALTSKMGSLESA